MISIYENITALAPFIIVSWTIVISRTVRKPQSYFNSVLLMIALFFNVMFITCFFGDSMSYALLVVFLGTMLLLFMVPVIFIINGIVMIKRESFCFAHILSLLLGIGIGIGELCSIVMVLGMAEYKVFMDIDKYAFFVMVTVFYFSSLLLNFVLYSIFLQCIPHRKNYDYIIIHGSGLADGIRITKLLADRIDKAIEVYQTCQKKPILIASGGKGSDEMISEAEAIGQYLMDKGIERENIILEDKSCTTMENLVYSKQIMDQRNDGQRVALVSNNYHVYRCLTYAKQIGMNCVGIGGGVALYFYPTAIIREFVAVFRKPKFIIWSIIGYCLFLLITSVLLFYM